MKELDDQERLTFFVDQIVENEMVWLLQADDGLFAMVEDGEINSYVTVWPTVDECKSAAKDEWLDYAAEPMEIKEFLIWLKELDEDKILVGVYPNAEGKILPFHPLELKKMIEGAWKKSLNQND